MNKNLVTLSVMLCYMALALAVPAKPGWHVITQSDGSTLKIQAVGNAFNNAILTTDGLTVERGADGVLTIPISALLPRKHLFWLSVAR